MSLKPQVIRDGSLPHEVTQTIRAVACLRTCRLALLLLASSYCFAAVIPGFTTALSITGCTYDDSFTNPGTTSLTKTLASPGNGDCGDGTFNSSKVSASGFFEIVDAGVITLDASTQGLGAHALGSVTFREILTVDPPIGFGFVDGTTGLKAHYKLTMDGPGPSPSDAGAVQLISNDLNVFQNAQLLQNGSASGVLDSGTKFVSHCPCSFEVDVIIAVNASNGTMITASDPITVDVPDGWTYSWASDDLLSAVPEPGMFIPIASALIVGVVWFHRRRNRRAA